MKWLVIGSLALLGIGLVGALGWATAKFVIIPTLLAAAGVAAWKFGLFKGTPDKTRKVKEEIQAEPFTARDAYRIAVVIGLIVLALLADPIVGIFFIGSLVALLILFFALPYVPGLVQALANEPNEFRPPVTVTEEMSRVEKAKRGANVGAYAPSTFALFTFIKPGRIKAIIRGQRFMRFIMRYAGKTFAGDQQFTVTADKKKLHVDEVDRVQMNQRRYWEVEKNKVNESENDSHPIPHSLRKGKLDLLWLWSRHVYDLTGAVFTGIPPFQTVEVYELEQLIKVLGSETGNEGEFVLIPLKDYSDHVRAAEFQFFVQVPGAETKDQVKVRLQFALTVMVTNPYKAFYDTDNRWASRLFTAVVQEVSAVVRGLPYRDVIAAEKAEVADQNPLLRPIMHLNAKPDDADEDYGRNRAAVDDIGTIGLKIKGAELIDAEVTDPKLAAALADIAKAQADMEARMKRADAEEYAVDIIAKAAKKHGEHGRLALQIEGNVRTAAAASRDGSSVILNIDSARGEQVDPRTAFLKKSIEGGSE